MKTVVTVKRNDGDGGMVEKTFENASVKKVAEEMGRALWLKDRRGVLTDVIAELMDVDDDAKHVHVTYNGANMIIESVE